ncbi:MAG: methylmalonyl-CoA mutase family protein [Terracidiphilus sp.]
MATDHLLDDFPPISTAEWEAAIRRDLKGADYQKKLIWRAEDGLTGKPYYRAEDLKSLALTDEAPGKFPFRRGARATGDWTIREEIDASDPAAGNRAALAGIGSGAEAIAFTGMFAHSSFTLEALTANLDEIPIHFEQAEEELLRLLLERTKVHQTGVLISTGFDPLSDLKLAAQVTQYAAPRFVPFTIHAEAFEESGATTVEEMGFALASGVDFLAAMQECGVDATSAARALEFRFAAGTDFFVQIAKLRAIRMLWARVTESFGAGRTAVPARIAIRTSRWNKTVYDPNVNILRAATETMAAVYGGADAITVAPFDECYTAPVDASRRLARNTQLLLKREAFLNRVADPCGGSYYLEALTAHLADEAWKSMQQIEALGGYSKAKASGFIVNALASSLAAREAAVARRRRVFIGTNQFADPAESALDRIDQDRMNAMRRGAQMYEQLRLLTEWRVAEGQKRPRVLLAEFGDVRMRTMRSNFASNLLACGGFEIAVKRFKKACEVAAESADLIVLCSADPEYAEMAAELMPQLERLGRATPVMIAGNPNNAEELKAAGIADFVHARSNPIELLTKLQRKLGIRD